MVRSLFRRLVILASCVLLMTMVLPLTMLPRVAAARGQTPQPFVQPQSPHPPASSMHHAALKRTARSSSSHDGCSFNQGVGGYYCYVTATQDTLQKVQGALANFSQHAPSVSPSDTSSLAELAVFNDTQENFRRVLEVGWIVAPDKNKNGYGDENPHLFVYTRDVDNQISNQCLVKKIGPLWSCGFQPFSGANYAPGDEVPSDGSFATIYILRYQSALWIQYGSNWIGSIPDSWWWGPFTEVGSAQWYGEVLAAENRPCTQMGNGTFGSQSGSATIASMKLSKGNGGPYPDADAWPTSTDDRLYDSGNPTGTSFTYGGPGFHGAGSGCPLAATLTPDSGPSGTSVTATGSGWLVGSAGPGDQICAFWDTGGGSPAGCSTLQQDGTFTITFTVPDNQSTGQHTVDLEDMDASLNQTSLTFTVTS